jgi:molybdate transport system permease protein
MGNGTGRGRRDALLWLAGAPMVLFLAIPLAALILRVAPGDVLRALTDAQVAQALSLSVMTTLITTGVTLLAGTPLAYMLARRHFAGHTIFTTLVELPIVLPPAVAGIALLVAFGRRGLVGQWLAARGIEIPFTPLAVILAQLFVAAPFYLQAAQSAFSQVRRELAEAATMDGASPWQIFRAITLPLVAPALFAGAIMTWARALGEFGATIIFAGNLPGSTQTLPLAIYNDFDFSLQTALTLSVILLVVAFGVLLLVKGLLRQRIIGGFEE